MVYDNGQDDIHRNNAAARIQALKATSCVKILGKGVIRIVRRVDDAKESNNLGESYLVTCLVYKHQWYRVWNFRIQLICFTLQISQIVNYSKYLMQCISWWGILHWSQLTYHQMSLIKFHQNSQTVLTQLQVPNYSSLKNVLRYMTLKFKCYEKWFIIYFYALYAFEIFKNLEKSN